MLGLEALKIEQDGFRLEADFQVAQGVRVAVLGPSGAGKSTLLSVIAGFLAPVAGRVTWQGADLAGLEPGKRPVSIVFQDNNLFPHLTVAQNVGLGLAPSLRLGAGDRARVAESLARVGLERFADRKPGALSGGQQSRVALARVLLRARPVLLLDEPFAALGPGLRAEMLDLVHEVAAETGATLLMVTHDPADARRLGGDTVLVADGVTHPPVETGALLADPPVALREYLGGAGGA